MGIHNTALIGASSQGYQISRSVRLRSSSTGYFTRVAGTPTSQNVWTISMWVKLGNLMSSTGTPNGCFFGANQAGNPNESIKWTGPAEAGASQIYYGSATTGGTHNLTRHLANNFRDPSAWYHLVFQKNASANSGVGMFLAWVNGVSATLSGAYVGTQASVPNYINVSGSTFNIGAIGTASSLDAYLAEINFVDGQALTPSSFGETNAVTGVWQPKKYAGTYGNNGFYLNFNDNSAATAAAIGKDSSGNGNNFTPSAGISVTAGATYDSMLDTPTPFADGSTGRGNYCTLNPVDSLGTTTNAANLNAAYSASGFAIRGTMAFPSTGKWYYEMTQSGTGDNFIGLAPEGATISNLSAGSTGLYAYYGGGFKYTNGSSTAYGATFTNLDVIGVAVDSGAGTVTFYKNNVSQGVAFTGLDFSTNWLPMIRVSGVGVTAQTNFGQRPFTYTPPTGFLALNTQNLPAPTITNGARHMAATTYTGTGASLAVTNTVNNISFQPDFVWTKVRNNTYSNHLEDSVRGVGQRLLSDSTGAEVTGANGKLTAFNSNGFTQDGGVEVGASAGTYVGWQWNAGGSTVTNTSGSISAQVRANPTAGFSIVTYTGTGSLSTVGHGLGVAPRMIIIKRRSTTGNWSVYHASLTSVNHSVYLNSTNAQASDVNTRGSAPSSTTFSVGTDLDVNASGTTLVAYCFAPVTGYSAFGSYTGNGSADGSFVFLGFRPRFVIIRRTDAGNNWHSYNSSSDPSNVVAKTLYPNTSGAEGTENDLDFVSNGMKMRDTGTHTNASGGTYIYMAWAENPFNNSLAR